MLEKLFPDQLVDEEDEKNTKVEKSNEQVIVVFCLRLRCFSFLFFDGVILKRFQGECSHF